MPQKVLVTGGTGFIGSHLATALYDARYEVIITGFDSEQKPRYHNFFQFEELVEKKIGCIDICFHQSANNDTTDTNRDGMIQANVEAPKALFEYLAQNGCKKFIYASSSAVYGHAQPPFQEEKTDLQPLNCYAESKMLFDEFVHKEFVKKYPVTAIGMRYTNVYGRGEDHKKKRASMIFQIIQKALKKEKIFLFKNGEQKRDWVYIEDVISMNMALIEHQESDIFNCGSGEAVTFNHLIELIGQSLGQNLEVEYIDCPFKEAYQDFTLADMTKAKVKLDFVPKNSVADGILKLCQCKNYIPGTS